MPNTNIYVKGTFNLGTDLSLTIVDNNTGQPVDLGGRLIGFEADPGLKEIMSEPLDNSGYNQTRQVWGSWTVTVDIDRSTGALDLLISQLEQEYHNKLAQHYFTITVVIFNSENNGTTTWIFNYCSLKSVKTGAWKKDTKVEVKLEFTAQNRPAAGQ